jgi:Concanavalin A-like lectin/glucanases superfamily
VQSKTIAYALPHQQFNIGAHWGSCELRFNGDIDEVRIFNRALSAAEIQNIFTALLSTRPTFCIMHHGQVLCAAGGQIGHRR